MRQRRGLRCGRWFRDIRARWVAALPAAALVAAIGACEVGGSLAPEISADIEEFVALLNDHRGSVGCGALAWNSGVAEVAQAHSQDMISRGFFDHRNPDGASPFDRLGAAQIQYSRAAENIAYGYGSARAVLDGWIGSPGHKANLENCALTQHGVGLVGTHWTHVFITP